MADSQDAIELKRRARRRLVGAIALVVFVVIALPIVLDREPKPVSQDLSIQIPSQDAARFSSRVLPADPPAAPAASSSGAAAKPAPVAEAAKPEAKAAEVKVTEAKAAEVKLAEARPGAPAPKAEAPAAKPAPAETKTEAKPEASPGVKSEPIPAPKAAPAKEAAKPAATEAKPAAAATDVQFVVPLGLFSKADNIKQVRAKATAAGFKTYTETVAGTDRVRVRAGPFASRDAAEQAREKLRGAGLDVGAVSAK